MGSRRQRAGRPVWEATLDLRGLSNLPFEEARALIVKRLTSFTWWIERNENVEDLIWEFDQTETFEQLVNVMDWLYDEADNDRVWIKSF